MFQNNVFKWCSNSVDNWYFIGHIPCTVWNKQYNCFLEMNMRYLFTQTTKDFVFHQGLIYIQKMCQNSMRCNIKASSMKFSKYFSFLYSKIFVRTVIQVNMTVHLTMVWTYNNFGKSDLWSVLEVTTVTPPCSHVLNLGTWQLTWIYVCSVLQSRDHDLWFSQPTSDKQNQLGKPDLFKNAVFTQPPYDLLNNYCDSFNNCCKNNNKI